MNSLTPVMLASLRFVGMFAMLSFFIHFDNQRRGDVAVYALAAGLVLALSGLQRLLAICGAFGNRFQFLSSRGGYVLPVATPKRFIPSLSYDLFMGLVMNILGLLCLYGGWYIPAALWFAGIACSTLQLGRAVEICDEGISFYFIWGGYFVPWEEFRGIKTPPFQDRVSAQYVRFVCDKVIVDTNNIWSNKSPLFAFSKLEPKLSS